MFKIVITMKRKPGLTRAQFIDYYNDRHLPFMSRVLPPLRNAKRTHRRNFVTLDDPFLDVVKAGRAVVADPDFDAMTEVIYETREDAMEMFEVFFRPEYFEEIRKDESNFVDMDSVKFYAVEVFEAIRG